MKLRSVNCNQYDKGGALVNKNWTQTKKIRHKKRIDVQDSSTFLTSFKLVRQTMPSIMQMRSADGRVPFPILLRRQVA